MYSLYIKFQEKIFTGKRIIQLWNFGNFGIPEIIPKILVTLRFSKISLHELKGNCKCFKMRYWPHFYVDPTHSNTYFSKVGIWRVLLQGTVRQAQGGHLQTNISVQIPNYSKYLHLHVSRLINHFFLSRQSKLPHLASVLCIQS